MATSFWHFGEVEIRRSLTISPSLCNFSFNQCERKKKEEEKDEENIWGRGIDTVDLHLFRMM